MLYALRRWMACAIVVTLAFSACSDDGSGFVDTDAAPPQLDRGPPVDGPAPDGTVPVDSTVGPPVTLKVATWNVKNFFDAQDDPSHFDDIPTATEVSTKIAQLGKALRQLDADVVALQEVENRQLLDRLVSEELSSMSYAQVRLIEGNDARGIDVALLSRFPVPTARSHVKDRFQGVDGDTTTYGFSRDCLEVMVEPAVGRRLILLVNHLAANSWRDPQEAIARRKAQAKRVREIADETLNAHPQANLAVIGDLNDTPDSQTLQLVRDGSPKLVDLLTHVPTSERYTHASKSQLDYILAAPGLNADLVSGSVKADHAQVYSDTSDHFPVVARFTLN